MTPTETEDIPEVATEAIYVLCSEEVVGILERRSGLWDAVGIGLLKLKGFPSWREVFLVLPKKPPLQTPESAGQPGINYV